MERLVEQLVSLVGAVSARLGSQLDISCVVYLLLIPSTAPRMPANHVSKDQLRSTHPSPSSRPSSAASSSAPPAPPP